MQKTSRSARHDKHHEKPEFTNRGTSHSPLRGSLAWLLAGAGLCLAACASNANDADAVSPTNEELGTSQQALTNLPTPEIPANPYPRGEIGKIVDWIQRETTIQTTPFCYKRTTYRDAGIVPSECTGGRVKQDGLCYQPCQSGFHGAATMCWNDKQLSYNPGRRCTEKDSLGTCWAWAMNSCADGYRSDGIATCWLTERLSYDRGIGIAPTACLSNRHNEDGLCYVTSQTPEGSTCLALNCTQNCVSGTTACGLLGCAKDQQACGEVIADQIVSPIMVLAAIGTAGAAGSASATVRAAKTAYQVATIATAIEDARRILQGAIEQFMAMAENNLAAISTNDVASAVALRYGVGSPTYKVIARTWAMRQMILYLADLVLDLTTLVVTTLDPTGVTSVIDAYAQPSCNHPRPMPEMVLPVSTAIDFWRKDTNRTSNGFDWANKFWKATCADTEAAAGLSFDPAGAYSHRVLCRPYGFTRTPTTSSGGVILAVSASDTRRSSREGDWAPGEIKTECNVDEIVSGMSQAADSSGALGHLRCSPAGAQFTDRCEVRDNSWAVGGQNDWDFGYAKAECAADKFVVGVSTVPGSRKARKILCCAKK